MKKRGCVLLAGQYVKTVKCIGNTYHIVLVRVNSAHPVFQEAKS